jgi:NAD(P)-dependent dehydrogenase (short-subunit alcohol dehydrogenase family)
MPGIQAGYEAALLGRIVNTTSSAVGLVIPDFTRYIAATMVAIGLARGLATEMAKPGRASTAAGGHADLPRWRAGS